jgi:hypothetical protein
MVMEMEMGSLLPLGMRTVVMGIYLLGDGCQLEGVGGWWQWWVSSLEDVEDCVSIDRSRTEGVPNAAFCGLLLPFLLCYVQDIIHPI